MHEPAAWFLLRDGDRHYLDVNCSQSAVSFSILVQLTDDEETERRALGRTFVDYLAAKVAYWPDRFRSRDLSRSLAAEVNAAVARWRADSA